MNEPYGHKKYQNDTLESLRLYLRRCGEVKDPAKAFVETTGELWGLGHPYNRVHELPNGETMPFDMPFVCLRIPTGGGKTVVGARAIRVFQDELLDTDQPLVLWLVPSDAIRTQTLGNMRELYNPLRQVLLDELGPVEILDGEDALNISPAALNSGPVIIVSTIQAFRVSNTDGRKVYENSGQLMSHFDAVPTEFKNQFPSGFPHSLANVLRLRRPLVIVDEAQNARSPLSMEVLERFQPRAILELTATPELKDNPSNVLHSVSAAELKAEQMIKLPIVLEALSDYKQVMSSAVAMLAELQKEAVLERTATGEYIRPILLLHAEPRDQDRPDALTVEVLENSLKTEFFIPKEQIAVATGERKELKNEDLRDENCKISFVITQTALREGWDCPFAYVLCSVANLHKSSAVEQLLGRILRMPGAKTKTRPLLNQSYAFVRSPHFFVAADELRDRLVQSAGFERREAREFFVPVGRQSSLSLDAKGLRSVTITLTEDLPAELPAEIQAFVSRAEPNGRELTITGRPPKAAVAAMAAALKDETNREVIRAAVAELEQHERIMASPAERGEVFSVPQLMLDLEGNGELVSPDEVDFLPEGWRLPLPPTAADLPALESTPQTEAVGVVDISEDGKVITRKMPGMALELHLIEIRENWTQVQLVCWLQRNIPHPDLEPDDMAAYLDAVVEGLQARPLTLGKLVRERFELRRRIETRIGTLRKKARQEATGELFTVRHVRVGREYVFVYNPNIYPCRFVCPRSREFTKHYYEYVGELDEKGEEYVCAKTIDELVGVEFWVRNLERQPSNAFWIQTSTDRFYPDFVCKLRNGKILVVEYKGADRSSNDDSKEKERLGLLWAERSGGTCLFIMVKGPGELGLIQALASSP